MMRFDHLTCCVACAAMFRPIREEDICPKCEAEEAKRLADIARENEGSKKWHSSKTGT